MQDISALVICHRPGKIEPSLGSTIGYRCDLDVINVVLVLVSGVEVRDIYRFPDPPCAYR